MCMRIYLDHPILVIFVIYVLLTCHDHPILCHTCDLCAANMPWSLARAPFMIYVLQTCRDHSIFILVIYVLLSCRDYLFECFTVLIPWLLACLFIHFDKNVIKTHFAIKTLKSKHGNVGVINEVGAIQGLRLALAFGHHGMSPLHWVWLVRAFV